MTMPATLKSFARRISSPTPRGQIDFDGSKQLLLTLASTTANKIPHELLLDMRQAQSELSATELWLLAAELSRHHRACPADRGRV